MTPSTPPISIAILNDYPVIVEGIAKLLADDDRLRVVELNSLLTPEDPVDVILYDTFGSEGREHEIAGLLGDDRYGRLIVYSWHTDQTYVDQSMVWGVDGFVSKAVDAEVLADAIVRVHSGERVIAPVPADEEINIPDWPARDHGLSPREAEVISLISQGATNEEIARSCYLSINSVKSYIRSAYRKMGVERRSQAVLWGVRNGMALQAERVREPEPSSGQ